MSNLTERNSLAIQIFVERHTKSNLLVSIVRGKDSRQSTIQAPTSAIHLIVYSPFVSLYFISTWLPS